MIKFSSLQIPLSVSNSGKTRSADALGRGASRGMPETTPLIKAALNLRVGAGFDVYNTQRTAIHCNGLFSIKLGDYNVGRTEQILTLPLYMAFLLTEL